MIQKQLAPSSYNLLTSPTVRNIVIFKQMPFDEQDRERIDEQNYPFFQNVAPTLAAFAL